jgi:phosphopantothenoylcysteine decarboxylase/phosphopantothenate--cysteine ligase
MMTKNGTEFVTPLTFESLSGNRVIIETFDRSFDFDIKHVSLAKQADIFVVAPATANVIAKFACGIADDMMSTSWLAFQKHKLIAPAMNTAMYEDATAQENIAKLKSLGVSVLEPTVGRLACGDTGQGKMAEPSDIVEEIIKILQPKRDFEGKTVLITAGGTAEPIDAVRSITNKSSGKQGIALAKAAAERGASVVLVAGKISEPLPDCCERIINVSTAKEMHEAVEKEIADIAIFAAAPGDYRLLEAIDENGNTPAGGKIKSEKLVLTLTKNPDIAASYGARKGNGKVVIFSAETENLLENAKAKMQKKSADMVVANDVSAEGAGFNVDTNIVTILTENGEESFPKMSKSEVANLILDKALTL